MSKSNPSDIKVAVPTPGAFAGLKALNLQVFVMIAAIIVIMLFFTWMTDGSYLSFFWKSAVTRKFSRSTMSLLYCICVASNAFSIAHPIF